MVDASMMDAFLSISGDCNPLHLDQAYAQLKGFQSTVVYGMLSSALYSRLVGVYLPGLHALLQSVQIDFVNPLYAGENVVVSGRINKTNDLFKFVEIKARITRGATQISRAKLKVGLLE